MMFTDEKFSQGTIILNLKLMSSRRVAVLMPMRAVENSWKKKTSNVGHGCDVEWSYRATVFPERRTVKWKHIL